MHLSIVVVVVVVQYYYDRRRPPRMIHSCREYVCLLVELFVVSEFLPIA